MFVHQRNLKSTSSAPSLRTFRPVAQIGFGGTTEVILAEMISATEPTQLAVLKKLGGDFAREPALVSRFLQNAKVGARLSHPNFVKIYEVFEDAGQPAFAMEYLDGQPLSRVLNRLVASKSFTPQLKVGILCDLLAGLHHGHDCTGPIDAGAKMIHGHLSPQHVFITYEGEVKILDFGYSPEEARITYSAPEQVRGVVDRRVDVFTCGILLWEMLSGQRLWAGMSGSEILRHLTTSRPLPRLSNVVDASTHLRELEQICARALLISPERRYPTAAAFASDLENVRDGRPASHRDQLGRLVSLAFGPERASRRVLIDGHRRRMAPVGEPASFVEPIILEASRATPGGMWAIDAETIIALDDDAILFEESDSAELASGATKVPSVEELPRVSPIFPKPSGRHRWPWLVGGFAMAVALVFISINLGIVSFQTPSRDGIRPRNVAGESAAGSYGGIVIAPLPVELKTEGSRLDPARFEATQIESARSFAGVEGRFGAGTDSARYRPERSEHLGTKGLGSSRRAAPHTPSAPVEEIPPRGVPDDDVMAPSVDLSGLQGRSPGDRWNRFEDPFGP